MSPTSALAGGESSQVMVQKGRTHAEPNSLLKLRWQSQKSPGTVLEYQDGQSSQGRVLERREICRGSPSSVQLSSDHWVHMGNKGWGINCLRGLEGTMPRAHKGLGYEASLRQPEQKTSYFILQQVQCCLFTADIFIYYLFYLLAVSLK